MSGNSDYVPALGFAALTRWYDLVVGIATREGAWRQRIVDLMRPEDGDRILDLGCGTGTLIAAIRMCAPNAKIAGIDADPHALAIARKRLFRAVAEVELHQGLAQRLPFPDDAFDVVVSSLFFHHLRTIDKRAVLGEARRVLGAGGRLVIADWGVPAGAPSRAGFLLVRLLDGFESTRDSVEGSLPGIVEACGFASITEFEPLSTPVGTVRFWSAAKSH